MEVMVVVDPQTPANGCLEFVPGSHKAAPTLVNGGRILEEWENSHEFVQLDLQPGMQTRRRRTRSDKVRIAYGMNPTDI